MSWRGVSKRLDVERRRAWNQASGRRNPTSGHRRGKAMGTSLGIARARYALWKNPGDLTGNQRTQLEWIAKTDPRLHRAYLLKEGLRFVFAVKGDEGKARARPVAVLGAPLTNAILRRARPQDRQTPSSDRPRTRLRALQRPHRVDQHQDPTPHPNRIRVPRTRTPHRPRHVRPRQPPTHPPRPKLTHRSSRRARYCSTGTCGPVTDRPAGSFSAQPVQRRRDYGTPDSDGNWSSPAIDPEWWSTPPGPG